MQQHCKSEIPFNITDCGITYPGIPTFGTDCNYRCHCRDNEHCDLETGECAGGCAEGWMGPACQYSK